MIILIDTSIIIDHIRAKDKSNSMYRNLILSYEPAISMITHTELYSGRSIWKEKKAKIELEDLINGVVVYPIDTRISQIAGFLVSSFYSNIADALIAATAIYYKLPLATLNEKDFKKITGLKILKN